MKFSYLPPWSLLLWMLILLSPALVGLWSGIWAGGLYLFLLWLGLLWRLYRLSQKDESEEV